MTEYTKGPWVVSGKATINSTKRGWIASVSTVDREANARLISAAPDMLEALELVAASQREAETEYGGRTYVECTACGATLSEDAPHYSNCHWGAVDAAIAKAKGQ